MRTLIILLLLSLTVVAQNAPPENPAFDAKLLEARASFEQEKFDAALRLTLEALEIGRTTFGPDSLRVAAVQNNLGVIYRSKGDYSEAVKSFEEAIRILESMPEPDAKDLISIRESLGLVHWRAGRNDSAEKQFRVALDIAEKKFGAAAFESYSPTFTLAKHYAWTGEINRGDDYFLKAYRIAFLRKGKEAPELDEIEDSRTCVVAPRRPADSDRRDFSKRLNELRDLLDPPKEKPSRPQTFREGVVNGKAKSLPRPEYPENLRFDRKSGAVVVRVLISEDGKVTSARATCGHPDFAKNAVKAALRAKFSPTLLGGEAVKVSGLIVYNFVAR